MLAAAEKKAGRAAGCAVAKRPVTAMGLVDQITQDDKVLLRDALYWLACRHDKKNAAATKLGLSTNRFNELLKFAFDKQHLWQKWPPVWYLSTLGANVHDAEQQFEVALKAAQGAFYRFGVKTLPVLGSGKSKSDEEHLAYLAAAPAVSQNTAATEEAKEPCEPKTKRSKTCHGAAPPGISAVLR